MRTWRQAQHSLAHGTHTRSNCSLQCRIDEKKRHLFIRRFCFERKLTGICYLISSSSHSRPSPPFSFARALPISMLPCDFTHVRHVLSTSKCFTCAYSFTFCAQQLSPRSPQTCRNTHFVPFNLFASTWLLRFLLIASVGIAVPHTHTHSTHTEEKPECT